MSNFAFRSIISDSLVHRLSCSDDMGYLCALSEPQTKKRSRYQIYFFCAAFFVLEVNSNDAVAAAREKEG